MEPKESLEIREKMAIMHDSVLERIKDSYNKENYIEVCWLCYACFESRINRIFDKIGSGCTKCPRTDNRHVGITTKLECIKRLIKSEYPLLKSEDINLIDTIKGWCKERNNLIHGMISLEYYNDADKKFSNLAKRGKALVDRLYKISGNVREIYYDVESIPMFDKNIVDKCNLKSKCIKGE